jgi:ComF family protein
VAYDDASRDLILGFKHADRLEALPLFVRWLILAAGERVRSADLLVPVPLHWQRLVRRRYNQAGLLAHGLGKATGVPFSATALRRVRATASQGEMVSARARLQNVARVFAVPDRARGAISGKSVAVIDDVLTTGATVSACAKALLRAGARDVSVVTLARVVRPLNI